MAERGKVRSGPHGPLGPHGPWRRRTVVEWLGKATVLALGGELLVACSGDAESAGADGGPVPAPCTRTDWPFEPGDGALEVFAEWPERTVDQQELASLLASWRLTVDGLVDRPVELSFFELLELPRQDQLTDLHCVEGWSVLDVPWNGVPLRSLLELAGPRAEASHLTIYGEREIYVESLPLDVAVEPRSLLAYGVGCQTLPLRHGFPLRLVVPRKLGYKGPKHVRRIELADGPVDGYWTAWGYPYEGDVPDYRLRPGKY